MKREREVEKEGDSHLFSNQHSNHNTAVLNININ